MKDEVEHLLSVIARVRAVGQASSPAALQRAVGPSIQHVVTGLGYLAALQRSPEAATALAAAIDPAVLESLQAVVGQWLSQIAKLAQTPAGFYDQASEHLRRLGGGGKGPPAPAPSAN